MHAAILVLLLASFLLTGCSGGPAAPLDMTALNPGHDHGKIAAFYRHEAVVSRQQAEELAHRAVVYEWLFGRESEWVTGTRLLAQFYEEAAREEEQLASRHLELLGDNQAPSPPTRSLGH
jgi:hypothetical protein